MDQFPEEMQKVFKELLDLDKSRERIFCRMENSEKHSQMLSEMPHVDVLDLSVVFYFYVAEDGECVMSVPINNQIATRLGLDADDLMEIAKANMLEKLPPIVEPIRDIIEDTLGPIPGEELFPMLVITNDKHIFGAATILCVDLLDTLAEGLGGEIYVMPSSIHEIIVAPMIPELDAAHLRQVVESVNRDVLFGREVLSDNLYGYTKDKGLYIIAE